jgi:deoxyxylulose-5-phosphate synthase
MFVFDRKLNFFSSSIVAATPSIATGVAWALKKKGSDKKVWCFIGDGAEDEGHFYEAANYVDGWELPCTFIVEDNDRSVNACKDERRGTKISSFFPGCVQEYCYIPTWPHGGTGTGGWLKFRKEAEIINLPAKQSSVISGCDINCDLSYMDAVKHSMIKLAQEQDAVFIGYNVKHGAAYGSLKDVPDENKIETPLAENLMMGLAMGMSLEGFRPVVFFERHEFVMNAMDAIVNTLDVIETISDGEFKMPVIIKAVSGSVKPFYAGLTHTRSMTNVFREAVHFPVYEPTMAAEVVKAYDLAMNTYGPVMISERKELY